MKVLLPVDGSEQAMHTIGMLSQLLPKADTELYLLTVRVPLATEVPWTQMDDSEAIAAILNGARQKAETGGFTVAKAEFVTFTDAADAICSYADEIGANLIVMGSHGYEGLAKFLMGSVSQKVFQHAKQPVVVVRNDKNCAIQISHLDQTDLKPLSSKL